MISVCVAVYRAHDPPNVAALGDALPAALGGADGELVVALNGIGARDVAVPADAATVDLGVNRGVAPAWNAAARRAAGETLVFCNDDVALGADSLARLAQALADRPGSVVGPVGSMWDLVRGRHLAWVRPGEEDAADRGGQSAWPAAGRTGEAQECDVVSGFLFACSRETFQAVGGFDEFYAPASWEEVDFCTAVRAAGGRCWVIGGVRASHDWGVSKRQMPWARARWDGRSETWRSIHRRNRSHFLSKWAAHPVARPLPAGT